MTDLITAHITHITAGGFSERTTQDREELLRRVDKALPCGLEQATTEELADWLARDEWSAQTKATYYGHIVGFFKWACDPRQPLLDWDPSAALIRPRVARTVPRPMSDDDLALIFEASEQPWRTYILLAAYAGLRAFEIAALRREDINRQTLLVRRGKGNKPAALPTHPLVWAAVEHLPKGPIARRPDGEAVTPNYMSMRTAQYVRDRLGLVGFSLHRCRHWYGTNLLRETSNLRLVQELLRHASPASTAIYTQVTDEERKMAVSALPVLGPVNPSGS